MNPIKTSLFEPQNKTAEEYKRNDSRDHIATSQFEWKPFTSPQRNYQEDRSNTSYQSKSISQENV